MSSFYYCNDCKKAVDLVGVGEIAKHPILFPICKQCGGSNWEAIIDTPSGEKEKK